MSLSEGEDDPCTSRSVYDMSTIAHNLVDKPDMSTEMCRVCGKNAAGKHYTVPACHGCKSFFRRAILNKTVYPLCKYDNSCFSKITRSIRPRKCRHCRLQKCHNVGMVAMVAIHRKQDSPSTDGELPDLSVQSPIVTREVYVAGIIDKLHNLDIQTDKFRKSAYNPFVIPSLEGILSSSTQLDLADKHGAMQGWPISPDSFVEQQAYINQFKTDLLNDNFSPIPIALPTGSTYGINTKEWLSFDMLTAVEYAKTFPFFQQLHSNDKILLTKATTFMNLSLTASYSSFLSKMGVLQMPDGIVISGPAGQSEHEVRSFERRLSTRLMAPLIRNAFDKTEYVLLKAIILCNCGMFDCRNSHAAQRILSRERHNFTAALLLYCLTTHGSSAGPARYYNILNMIDVLEHHQRDFRDFMLLLDMTVPDRNVLCMIAISIVLCPIFYLPMIGYQSNGLIRFVPLNMAFPAILTVYCLLGVVISIMDLFHYRLRAISSMNTNPQKIRIRLYLQRLVYLTYIILILTAISYLGLLTVQSSQPTIKPMIFEKYHMSEVWCPKFLVSDPYSWPIILAICTTFIFIVCVASVVLLCGAFTLVILLSSRKDLSENTLKVQKRFTAILIVQAAVHVIFILGPIITIVVSVYFDIYINDGGLVFFFVEAQQGTASTLVFIFTHSVTKKSFNYATNHVRKTFGLQASNSIWRTSKVELRSKSVV